MSDTVNKIDLMAPRIKVIADWPGVAGIVKIGEIINVDDEFTEDMFWIGGEPFLIDKIRDYPYLFKELEWWEEREEKDMPGYIRYGDMAVYKVRWDFTENNLGFIAWAANIEDYSLPLLPHVRPATEEEYNQYINNKK